MMLSYDDAVKKILDKVKRMEVLERPLPTCVGNVVPENIYTDIDLPQSAIAGPDGYAVRSADIKGATQDNPAGLRGRR
jgi:molybdopterin molybdotransferase